MTGEIDVGIVLAIIRNTGAGRPTRTRPLPILCCYNIQFNPKNAFFNKTHVHVYE